MNVFENVNERFRKRSSRIKFRKLLNERFRKRSSRIEFQKLVNERF